MIQTAQFTNVKALKEVELTLSQFTVLVGPNASGKTSVLQSIFHLMALSHFHPESVFNFAHAPAILRSAGSSGSVAISIAGNWNSINGNASIVFKQDNAEESGQTDWRYILSGTWGDRHFQREEVLFKESVTEQGRIARDAGYREFLRREGAALKLPFSSAIFLRLNAARLAEPSYSEDQVPWLQYDGAMLASVLAHLALKRPEKFRAIEDSMRSVIPSLRRIRLDRARVFKSDTQPINGSHETVTREFWGNVIELDMGSSLNTPAQAVSEGTLLVLGLFTAIHAHEAPSLVLLDDIDRGLHPKALAELVSQLRIVLKNNPAMQIVATTHSPYLIDEFEASEVRLLTVDENGFSVCGSLADHPDFDRWKDLMHSGEFWSTVGEQWLLDKKEHADVGK